MKKTLKLAVAAAALIGFAGAAQADVTLTGPTGLFINPISHVSPKGTASIGAHYARIKAGSTHLNLYGVAGVVGVADNVEVSGSFNDLEDANSWNIGAKYQIFTQSEKGFGLAVGANYTDLYGDAGHKTDVYAVGTKGFANSYSKAPIVTNLGVRYNDYSQGSSQADVFAGALVPLTKSGELGFVAEWGTKQEKGGESVYAVGLRYQPDGAAYNVAAGVARDLVCLRLNYTFGK